LPGVSDQASSVRGGAVIVPAHNEAAVIGRLLDEIAPLAADGIDVVIACNGCTDGTVEIARGYPAVHVLELAEPSKVAALNAGDEEATQWPRLYVDADIEVTRGAILATLDRLVQEGVLAARPSFRYDVEGASWVVRAYYRARRRLPSAHRALWGAGVYGLSKLGHDRLGRFPSLVADDLFVDSLFERSEFEIVSTVPVVVRTPRNTRALMAILHRGLSGRAALTEANDGVVDTTRETTRELIASVRGLRSLVDAGVYAALAAAARRHDGRNAATISSWERDDSSRSC
jgi:glycosyltransferase involved in cell wall biosynthesis